MKTEIQLMQFCKSFSSLNAKSKSHFTFNTSAEGDDVIAWKLQPISHCDLEPILYINKNCSLELVGHENVLNR